MQILLHKGAFAWDIRPFSGKLYVGTWAVVNSVNCHKRKAAVAPIDTQGYYIQAF